jgi:hypothetical protein
VASGRSAAGLGARTTLTTALREIGRDDPGSLERISNAALHGMLAGALFGAIRQTGAEYQAWQQNPMRGWVEIKVNPTTGKVVKRGGVGTGVWRGPDKVEIREIYADNPTARMQAEAAAAKAVAEGKPIPASAQLQREVTLPQYRIAPATAENTYARLAYMKNYTQVASGKVEGATPKLVGSMRDLSRVMADASSSYLTGGKAQPIYTTYTPEQLRAIELGELLKRLGPESFEQRMGISVAEVPRIIAKAFPKAQFGTEAVQLRSFVPGGQGVQVDPHARAGDVMGINPHIAQTGSSELNNIIVRGIEQGYKAEQLTAALYDELRAIGQPIAYEALVGMVNEIAQNILPVKGMTTTKGIIVPPEARTAIEKELEQGSRIDRVYHNVKNQMAEKGVDLDQSFLEKAVYQIQADLWLQENVATRRPPVGTTEATLEPTATTTTPTEQPLSDRLINIEQMQPELRAMIEGAIDNPRFPVEEKFVYEDKENRVKLSTEELAKRGYAGYPAGEYEEAGRREILPDGSRQTVFSRGSTKDTIVEEAAHALYDNLERIEPELARDIIAWESAVLSKAEGVGIETLGRGELFAKVYTFAEMGYATVEPEIAEISAIPQDILERFNLHMGASTTGKNSIDLWKGKDFPKTPAEQRKLYAVEPPIELTTTNEKVFNELIEQYRSAYKQAHGKEISKASAVSRFKLVMEKEGEAEALNVLADYIDRVQGVGKQAPVTTPAEQRADKLPPLGYAKAKKQADGSYKLFYIGTENEIFPGEKFKSASEARNYLKVQLAKQQTPAPATESAPAPEKQEVQPTEPAKTVSVDTALKTGAEEGLKSLVGGTPKGLAKHGLKIIKTTTNNGNPVWEVSGDTTTHKAALKEAGGRWYGAKKVWSFYGAQDPTDRILSEITSKDVSGDASEGKVVQKAPASYTGLDRRLSIKDAEGREYGEIVKVRARVLDESDPRWVELSKTVRETLKPHQVDGVRLAIASIDRNGGFILADGTGGGKTLQILATADHYLKKGNTVLIVVPNRAIISDAYTRDGGLVNIDVHEARDGNLASDKINITTYTSLNKFTNENPDYIVFDESHKLKNTDTKQSILGLRMADRAKGVLFASATPFDKGEHLPYLSKTGLFDTKSHNEIMTGLGYKQETITVKVKGGTQQIQVWKPDAPLKERIIRMEALFNEVVDLGLMVKREVSMNNVAVGYWNIKLPQEAHRKMEEIEEHYLRMYNRDDPELLPPLAKAQMLLAQRRFQEHYKVADAVKLA